jgi:hypothetical protein
VAAELIVVDAATGDAEETRITEISRQAGRPILEGFGSYSGSAVLWPLRQLLREAKTLSPKAPRAEVRHIT